MRSLNDITAHSERVRVATEAFSIAVYINLHIMEIEQTRSDFNAILFLLRCRPEEMSELPPLIVAMHPFYNLHHANVM